MKTLKDGTNVSSRIWYYLLDFLNYAPADGYYLAINIRELNKEEFFKLFQEATQWDMGKR